MFIFYVPFLSKSVVLSGSKWQLVKGFKVFSFSNAPLRILWFQSIATGRVEPQQSLYMNIRGAGFLKPNEVVSQSLVGLAEPDRLANCHCMCF